MVSSIDPDLASIKVVQLSKFRKTINFVVLCFNTFGAKAGKKSGWGFQISEWAICTMGQYGNMYVDMLFN